MDPLGAVALAVLRVVQRDDLVLEHLVDGSGVKLILVRLVLVGAVLGQCPACALYVTLVPPTVLDGEVEYAVHLRFLTGCTGSLQRTGRRVQPDIHTGDEAFSKAHIVVLEEDDLTQELRHTADLDDALDQALATAISRVRLTGEEELYRIVRVVHQLIQTLQIGEEQVRTFVGSETATETDDEVIRVHLVQRADDTGRITLALHPILAELLLDIIHHLAFQAHTRSPDYCIRDICVRLPHLHIRLVVDPLFRQVFLVDLFPLVRCPSRHVYTVGDIIYVQLLREIARPNGAEHLLRHLSVEPRNAICFLAGVEGEDGHREFLGVIIRIRAAHADQVVPLDTQFLGVLAHVFVEQALLEVVVTSGHRRMAGVETRSTNDFFCLVEGQTLFLYQVHEALQTHQRCVTLVAVVYIFLDA